MPPPPPPPPHGLYPMLPAALPPLPLPPPTLPHHHLPSVSGPPLPLDTLVATVGGCNVNYGLRLPFPRLMLPPSTVAATTAAPGRSFLCGAPMPPTAAPPTSAAEAELATMAMMPTMPPTASAPATCISAETAVLATMTSILPTASSQPQGAEVPSAAATSTSDVEAPAPAPAIDTSTPTAATSRDATVSSESSKENEQQQPAKQPRPTRTKTAKVLEVASAEPVKRTTQSLDIDLAPADGSLLSDYNALLCQHIELYQDTSGSKAKVGVRCKLCVGLDGNQGTAASYLASSISFISPNIGNIGTRHLLAGKCPAVSPGVAEKLKVTRKTSMGQTRMPGRIGLDAYCRDLAARNGIVPYSSGGGIFHSGRSAAAAAAPTVAPSAAMVSTAGGGNSAPSSDPAPTAATAATRTVPTKPKRTKRKRSRDGDSTTSGSCVDSNELSPMDVDPVVVDSASTVAASLVSSDESCSQPTTGTAMEVDDSSAGTSTSSTTAAAAEVAAENAAVSAVCKENDPPTHAVADGETTALIPKKRFTNKPEMPLDASSFVPGSVKLFWECSHCSSLPVPHRAAGSVVFSADPPTLDKVKGHLQRCTGLDALPIPRDAKLTISGYSEKVPPIRISWDSSQLAKRTKTIEMQRTALAAGKPWPPLCQDVGSFLPSGEVNGSVEKTPLVRKGVAGLVTQYTYTTVTLVRKCYLTQTGGSRGAMSLGYPGLGCSFCAGKPNQKRFFYTSADNLRNSFAHIPGHLISCPYAPIDVRRSLQSLKAKRSEENKNLNRRDHKAFLDQIWRRLHSKSKAVYEEGVEFDSDDDEDDGMNGDDQSNTCNATADEEAKSSGDDMDKKPRARTSRSRSSGDGGGSSDISNGSDGDSSTRTNAGALRFVDTSLVKASERLLTSDLNFLSLQVGVLIYTLQNSDIASVGGSIGQAVLACRFCNRSGESGRVFMPTSAKNLKGMVPAISNHICSSCPLVPRQVRSELEKYGGKMKEEQEAGLKRGSVLQLCENVFGRLLAHDTRSTSQEAVDTGVTRLPKNATSVVLAEDKATASDYCFYSLSQMMPCILDEKRQGSRGSAFPIGTPGLACRHCASSTNPREFYFRNADVMANNYAHISSHILSCPHAPKAVKTALLQKKAANKNVSNRPVLRIVWGRMKLWAKDQNENDDGERVEDGNMAEAAAGAGASQPGANSVHVPT